MLKQNLGTVMNISIIQIQYQTLYQQNILHYEEKPELKAEPWILIDISSIDQILAKCQVICNFNLFLCVFFLYFIWCFTCDLVLCVFMLFCQDTPTRKFRLNKKRYYTNKKYIDHSNRHIVSNATKWVLQIWII